MSIDKARPDFIAAQEILSNRWPMDVLEALDTCIRELARAEFAKLIPVPADMRKPEDGGTREAYSYAVSLFSHLAPQCEPLPDLIGVLTQIDNATTIIPTLRATIAERDRRIEELEAATKAAIRAAELALFVIRKQGVMPNASWERGFDVDLATARALLSGQQDTGGAHG